MNPQEFRKVAKGVFVMMTTPFLEDRNVDYKGVRKHVRFLMEKGIKTGEGVLVPVGSTGECPMMSIDEIKKVMKIVVDEAKGNVPVMPTCNHTDTRVVMDLVKYAEEIGADGVMVSPHYYWKPTRGLLLQHYKHVASATSLGIFIDNCNFATGADIEISDIEMLIKEIPQIVGFKENSCDIGKWDLECRKLGDKVNFIAGNGDCHWPYVALAGSVGNISAMSNFIPDKVIELWHAVKEEDWEKAKAIHRKYLPISIFNSRFDSEKYKSFIKELMNELGLPAGPTRLPLCSLSDAELEQVKNAVGILGLK